MDMEKLTPMMRQYLKTKDEYSDTILFYRLGDFYEMFFEDAKLVSRELELTLTGKDCGLSERAPMCGIPYHSANNYISKLIEKGYKVAICEQMEDAKNAKGLVKRDVVKVITPGTVIDQELLKNGENNYLAVIFADNRNYGLTFADISTGEIYTTSVTDSGHVLSEVARYLPSELLVNEKCPQSIIDEIELRLKIHPSVLIEKFFEFDNPDEKISVQFPECSNDFKLDYPLLAKISVCAFIRYMEHTQKGSFAYINKLKVYSVNEYMDIDAATRRNLEITETLREKTKVGSLLETLDFTKTSMGARLLKQWLEKPLIDADMIRKRLNAVEELIHKPFQRDELIKALDGIYDIARITSRLAMASVTPRDMIGLRDSLRKLPSIKKILNEMSSKFFVELNENFDLIEDTREYLNHCIVDDPPATLRDGGVIKPGYDEELDKLNNAKKDGSKWIQELEARERESTGIKNLKVSFNKVFGYYIEVTKSFASKVPPHYQRKQTLVNAERFITPELKELENIILGSSEKSIALELKIYKDVIARLLEDFERYKSACMILSACDCVCSFAEASIKYNYVKPDINDDGKIEIRGGRHPVVERRRERGGLFVPNDTTLDTNDNRMLIITGPNMAGKSTYMRQVAVISLMAQIGCFVPAEFARLCVVDKIFTRVGASDDIGAGQSTFMVEMSEVAHIINGATDKSLIILDEIGRGTSTYDGLAIAWSVVEYINNKKNIGAKTLFATHYHELTQLEDKLDGVKNYNIAVRKNGDDITFLRKIVRGGADESYGIEVAALAGVPKEVIKRAKEILKSAEKHDLKIETDILEKSEEIKDEQIDFNDVSALQITEELKRLDATTLTPIEAMNKLYELSNKAREI